MRSWTTRSDRGGQRRVEQPRESQVNTGRGRYLIGFLLSGRMSQTCGRSALPEAQPSEFYRLQKVAEDGDASAQLNLGFIFDSGEGVPKDTVQAYA